MVSDQSPKKPGRKPFEPTKEQRLTVRVMAGACGMPHPLVCQQIINPGTGKPIDEKTLRLKFREELDDGKAAANAMVAQSLFKKATSDHKQSVTAAIFWLKTQAGWKEPAQGIELANKEGETFKTEQTLDLANVSDADLVIMQAILAKAADARADTSGA